MKRFLFAAVLVAAFLSTLTQAQTIDLRATIPFSFRVGQTEMPAGEYVVHHQGGTLILREQSGRHAALIGFALGAYRPAMMDEGRLEFNRYGATYFLAKLWPPASQMGVALPQTSRERELARQFGVMERANIALAGK